MNLFSLFLRFSLDIDESHAEEVCHKEPSLCSQLAALGTSPD
jgi:hypothetical protein